MGVKDRIYLFVKSKKITIIALAHNVPITTVAKMLGHQDIRTTQIYAKVLRKTVEDNTKELLKAIDKEKN